MRYLSETGERKYRYIMLLAVILVGVVSILGTGGNGDGGTPPVITAVAPPQSSDSALVTALVAAQFGIDMDGASINDSSFTLVDNAMTAVLASNISYDVGSRIATFVPSTDLTSGAQYIATLTAAVQDAAGNYPLARDYVWSFQVAPTLVPVSVNGNGVYGDSTSSTPASDQTGRYVVFESAATTLVPGIPINSQVQIYRKDTVSGEVQLVSTDNSGLVTANGAAAAPRISADGRFIVFDSPATNLDLDVASGGIRQVYLKDMETGSITLLSRANATTGGDNVSSSPDISADGRFIAFHSNATDLIGIGNDTNGARDVFLHDTQTTTTTRVSVTTGGAQVNGASSAPAISADGRYIAFESVAANLVAGDTNSVPDIYRVHRTHQ